jgi:PAS domain S-box-containing protein
MFALSGLSARAEPNPKSILVLYSFSDRVDFSAFNALKAGLQSAIPLPLNFYVENLEGRRFDDEIYRNNLAASLRDTYRAVKLDLVLVENDPALEFALKYRDELFPGVPIVFFDVDAFRMAGQKMWPGVAGVTAPVDIRGTVDFALRLYPDTDTVAIVTGNSPYERYWLALIHAELLHHQGKIRETDLVALPANQLFDRVIALPQHAIVLFQLGDQETPRLPMGAHEMLSWIAERRPTYCVLAWFCLNHGGVGGDTYDGYQQISLVAKVAGRVLSGEKPENIHIVNDSRHWIVVDWRALRRWHISESALPPGSIVLYRQPTLWERDKKYTIPGVVLLLLVVGLLWQRAWKRKAEAVLRESEKRFQVMADTTPSLIWMCDAQGKMTYLNERRIAFTGPEPDAGFGDTWIAYVHPDDQMKILESLSRALETRQPFSQEYRLRRSDGVYRWMFDVASPRVNGDGSFGGFIGSAIDTTDQKLAQEALEKVSGQLIDAQEKERSRIARDLHDDICQRLALLSMEIEQANRRSDGSPATTKKSLEDIRKHCSEIAGDVQSLSHQLHSSRLDSLGIVAAIRGFCGELSKQHEIAIEFSEADVPAHLPKDICLCLFRVAQEALHNAVKYSRVSQFTVELSGVEGGVQLMVSDAGAGFDVQAAKKNGGLGLLSMQERIRLVDGSFSVESKPWQRTRVVATVPLIAEREWSAEDGEVKETMNVTGIA